MSVFGVFLVLIFPHSDWILRISPYSVRMREKTDQKISEYGHFYAVNVLEEVSLEIKYSTYFWHWSEYEEFFCKFVQRLQNSQKSIHRKINSNKLCHSLCLQFSIEDKTSVSVTLFFMHYLKQKFLKLNKR